MFDVQNLQSRYCNRGIVFCQICRLPAVCREVARNVSGAVAALDWTLDELPRLPYPVTEFPIKVVAVIASVNKYIRNSIEKKKPKITC